MDVFDSAEAPASSASPSSALMAGAQDSDDACSICLEPFTADDPATVTKKQRVPNMLAVACLEGSREVPSYADDSDFDERIMQHLTAAAMGRTHHFSRREWHRSSGMSHSEILVFPSPSNESDVPQSHATNLIGSQGAHCFVSPENGSPTILLSPTTDRQPTSSSHASMDSDIGDNSQTATPSPRRSRSSELFSFSDSLKAKLSAASSRYKESISRSTRGLKEKLLSRNGSVKELSKEVQREVTAGIAGVARMMERLDPSSKRSSSISGGNEGTSESSPSSPGNRLTDSPNGSGESTTLGSSSNATFHTSGALSSGSELNFGLTHVQLYTNAAMSAFALVIPLILLLLFEGRDGMAHLPYPCAGDIDTVI
ncbi:hypothetical protein ACLOJK_016627 [Asimina triloba]